MHRARSDGRRSPELYRRPRAARRTGLRVGDRANRVRFARTATRGSKRPRHRSTERVARVPHRSRYAASLDSQRRAERARRDARRGELYATSVHTPEGWELEITDSGTGWSDDALQRASEPFFTTKSHGTGLGLAIVERIMDAHGGHMLLRNCATGGASVTLCFPHMPAQDALEDGPIIAAFPGSRSTETISRRSAA
ncbi:MAG: sensor histidine kinase [Pirellulales bacterium]